MKIFIIFFILIVFTKQHRSSATNVTSTPEKDGTTTEVTPQENIEDAISLPLRQEFDDTADQLVLESIISRTRREPPFTIIRHRTKSSKHRSSKPRRKVRRPKPVYGPPHYSSGKPITYYKPKVEYKEPSTVSFKSSHGGGSTKGSYTENSYDFASDLKLESPHTYDHDIEHIFDDSNSNLYDTQSIKFDLTDTTYDYGAPHSTDSLNEYYGDTFDFDKHETESPTGPPTELTHSYEKRPKISKKPHAIYGVPPPEPPNNYREPSIATYDVTPNLYETIVTSKPHVEYGVPPPEPPKTYSKPSYPKFKYQPSYQNFEVPISHFAEPSGSHSYETQPQIPSKYQPPLQNDFHESDYSQSVTFNTNYDKAPSAKFPSHGSTFNNDFSVNTDYFPTYDDSTGAPSSSSGNSYHNSVGHFAEPPLKKAEKSYSNHKIPISHFPLEERKKISNYDSPKTSYEVPIYEPIPFDSGFKGGHQENYPPIHPNKFNNDYTDEDTRGTTKVEVNFPKTQHKNPIKYQTQSTFLTNDVTQINNLHTLSASLEELTEPPEGLLDQLMSTSSKVPRVKRKRNRTTGPKRHILDADELRNAFRDDLKINPRPSSTAIVPLDKPAKLDVTRRQTTYFSSPPPTEKNFVLLSAANNEAPTSVTPFKWEPTKLKTNYIRNSRQPQENNKQSEEKRNVEVSIQKSHSHSYYGGTIPPEVFKQSNDPVFTQKQTNTRRDFSTIGLRNPGFIGSSYKKGRQFHNTQNFEDDRNDDDFSEIDLEEEQRFRPTNHKYKK